MCMVWPCHSFVDGHSLKCINVHKKVKLINHDCLPILMLLYIMLAYLMLLGALSSAVSLYDAFLLLIFANAFCFMLCLSLLTHSLLISSMLFHHLLVFPYSMFTPFFI